METGSKKRSARPKTTAEAAAKKTVAKAARKRAAIVVDDDDDEYDDDGRDVTIAALGRLEDRFGNAWWQTAKGRKRVPDIGRQVFALFYLDADVRNGGFDQYFGNWSDILTNDAIACLRAIRAPVTTAAAKLVERAAKHFRKLGAAAKRRRERDAAYAPIDEAYYAMDSEELFDVLGPYVHTHRNEF